MAHLSDVTNLTSTSEHGGDRFSLEQRQYLEGFFAGMRERVLFVGQTAGD